MEAFYDFSKTGMNSKMGITIVIWVLENASYHKLIYATLSSACVICPIKE